MLSENKIIAFLKQQFPEAIGDDAAVFPFSDTESYVITKDLLVEDVHFRCSYCDPKHLASKALQVNLSDIAAMGAQPKYVLLGISVANQHENYIDAFLTSFAACCKQSAVLLIGGDTTGSPDKLFISVTVIGIIKKDNLKYRHLARNEDIICVAGNLGFAHLGFLLLEHDLAVNKDLEQFKTALQSPKARLEEGAWFGTAPQVTAMMDLSDGLLTDLKKLCQASCVGASVDLTNVAIIPEFAKACETLNLDPTSVQLIGGEDYSLLVTIKSEEYPKVAQNFAAHFGYELKQIGKITANNGVIITPHPTILQHTNSAQPFSHFGENT